MTVRSTNDAIKWGRARVGDYGWYRLCLMFVRMCFNVDPLYRKAIDAWNGAEHKHHFDGMYDKVPRGVPFFFSPNHVCLTIGLDRNGHRLCLSNDVRVDGRIDIVRLSSIAAAWNVTPLGWTEDLNGKRVYTPRPSISLKNVIEAYDKDQHRPKNDPIHPVAVGYVERALVVEKLLDRKYVNGRFGGAKRAAYKKWQERLGYTGVDADGKPGRTSLTRLGRRHGFDVR